MRFHIVIWDLDKFLKTNRRGFWISPKTGFLPWTSVNAWTKSTIAVYGKRLVQSYHYNRTEKLTQKGSGSRRRHIGRDSNMRRSTFVSNSSVGNLRDFLRRRSDLLRGWRCKIIPLSTRSRASTTTCDNLHMLQLTDTRQNLLPRTLRLLPSWQRHLVSFDSLHIFCFHLSEVIEERKLSKVVTKALRASSRSKRQTMRIAFLKPSKHKSTTSRSSVSWSGPDRPVEGHPSNFKHWFHMNEMWCTEELSLY